MTSADDSRPADLLIAGAELVVTVDDQRREIAGGWVAMDGANIRSVGPPGREPPARRTLRAQDCLVTPGLVNTHHHLFQNLTRAFAPALAGDLFHWLQTLYPIWTHMDEEAAYLSAWVGVAELLLGGCTTTTDHLYAFPPGAGDLLGAEIQAATELGARFHPTRGSMSLAQEDGGPPDSLVEDDDDILADCERAVARWHDRSPGAMVRLGLAPCSLFTVTEQLMVRTAELAERLDVRVHTHIAESHGENRHCLERFGRRPVEELEAVGWSTDRAWLAHCVWPSPAEVTRLGRWGVGAAHCPSSNLILGSGLAPVAELRAAGCLVGIGCDGSASADAASLWLESRTALLLAHLRGGPSASGARDILAMATLEGAGCLGRSGEVGSLEPGAAADVVCWPLDGPAFAGASSDPVEAWLRCGPLSARHTVVAGRPVVVDGALADRRLPHMLSRHAALARRWQGGENAPGNGRQPGSGE